MGGTALGASGRSNNGLKLDVKTGKLSLWRLFPTFTFTLPNQPVDPRVRDLKVSQVNRKLVELAAASSE